MNKPLTINVADNPDAGQITVYAESAIHELVATLRSAYVNLLRVKDSDTRWALQSTMCDLRDKIAEYMGCESEAVQVWHETYAVMVKEWKSLPSSFRWQDRELFLTVNHVSQ